MVCVPLVLAATPIGNPADASPRLRDALATADVVAAEDTRRLRRLAAALDVTVTGRVVSYYDAIERSRTERLLGAVRDGHTVLLVTDAGTPLVSDPGFRLVAAVAAAGLPVTVIPGPSAVLAALAVSGLPTDRWSFEGFLPRKAGERRQRLTELARDKRTTVLFEAPLRVAATLAELAGVFGADRPAVVCRELTKTYEEVRRGSLAELAAWAADGVRGEVTLVVAGAGDGAPAVPDEQLAAEVQREVDAGMSRRDAIDHVAGVHGISRRVVYRAATTL
jgi:16S rRNA (cytidine1402-2'-O)-methyltransferase